MPLISTIKSSIRFSESWGSRDEAGVEILVKSVLGVVSQLADIRNIKSMNRAKQVYLVYMPDTEIFRMLLLKGHVEL